MNEEQSLIYLKGIILQAEIRMQAMIVANKEREINGEALAYNEQSFLDLINEFGIHHNALITGLAGG